MRVTHTAILASFFLAAWWLRLDRAANHPYIVGFLLIIPLTAAILSWLFSGLPGLRPALRDRRRWWIMAALLLGGWAWWSPQWAVRVHSAENSAIQLAVVLLFSMVVLCAAPSPRRIALALVCGGIVQAVIAIGQVAVQHDLGLQFLGEFRVRPDERGLSLLFAAGQRLMRPYGLTVHPNVVGGYLAVSLLALSGWLFTDQRRWKLAGWLAYLIVVGLLWWALLLTFSRAAWLGLAAGMIVLMLRWLMQRSTSFRPRWRRLTATLGLLIVLGVAFLFAYAPFVRARAGVGAEVTELRSVNDRLIYAQAAVEFIGKYPITGVGMGNFVYRLLVWLRSSPYGELGAQHVHNVPLLIAAEIGVTGVVLWLGLLALGIGTAWSQLTDPFALTVGIGTAALFTIGLFDHYPWTIMHFQMLALSCLAAALRFSVVPSTPVQPAASPPLY